LVMPRSVSVQSSFSLIHLPPPPSTLFPYTTLFRSSVPVPASLAQPLKDHLKTIGKSRDALLFPRHKTENQLHNPNTVRKRFNKARDAAIELDPTRRARLAGFTFHGLRHSCLTRIGQAGATLADLMAYAGHSDVDSVLIYQHSEKDRLASLAGTISHQVTLNATR